VPRPRTRDDADVLAAAARVMGARGPAGTTLAAVGAEAGLAPATLLQRFGSKRGLMLAVARGAADQARAHLVAAEAEHADDPVAAVVAVHTRLVAGVRREEMAHHLAFLGLDVADPEFRAAARDQAAVLRAGTAALLTRAVATGVLAAGVDPWSLARAVRLVFDGALVAWALEDADHPDRDAATAVAADLRDRLDLHRAHREDTP
jgi:AcrR family transcriptional regulator